MVNENITSLLEQEAEAVRNIPVTPGYEEAVSLIVKHVHDLGGKLIMSGMGKAGQIALNIATTFSSTGTPAFFLHPSEAQHGDLGIVRENDIMLLISNSGKTRELVELVDLTRGLVPDMKFIVITSNPDSPLAAEANVCLFDRRPQGSLSAGPYTHYLYDRHDGNRRYPRGRNHEAYPFHQQGLRQAPSRGLLRLQEP